MCHLPTAVHHSTLAVFYLFLLSSFVNILIELSKLLANGLNLNQHGETQTLYELSTLYFGSSKT